MTYAAHIPVMLDEAITALAPGSAGVYVDATFGAGGYTRAILDRADCTVYGIDRDPLAIARAAEWADDYRARLRLINRPFAEMEAALAAFDVDAIDGAVFDLGVSSMQLDEAERGFSFRRQGPLSMRMDGEHPDAGDLINTADADDLAAIFKAYGEERRAKTIARAIVRERNERPIRTSQHLAAIIATSVPAMRQDRIHPATRAFQALRIFVNGELEQLAIGLLAVERLLRPAGRLVVVTFHSLEDRIVKRFLAERSGGAGAPSRHAPPAAVREQTFRLLNKAPIKASLAEVGANPRARSAKLRAAERTRAPPANADFQDFLPRLSLSPGLSWS